MECELCKKERYSEEYPFCPECMGVGMGEEKRIGRFESLSELLLFVEKLQEEFVPTNFAAILPLLQPAFYYYNADLQYSDEGSFGARSELRVRIEGGVSWGAQTPAEFYCSYIIGWNTSSGHHVRIEGEVTDKYTGEGDFRIYRRTDESEVFYPIVEKIVKKVKEDS